MIGILVYWVALLMVITRVNTAAKRHEVYWNALMQPRLLAETAHDLVYNVQIGEFMDILCPQKSLMGAQVAPKFNIFNVTKKDYQRCHYGAFGNAKPFKNRTQAIIQDRQKNFIFACNKPDRENKLTLKFQTISPSPLGFRFRYCTEYYFVAVSELRNKAGCMKNSTRIRIVVKCREDQKRPKTVALPRWTTTKPKPTKTTTEKTTATTRKITTKYHKLTRPNKVVHPPLRLNKPSPSPKGPGGGGCREAPSGGITLLMTLVAALVTSLMTRTLKVTTR